MAYHKSSEKRARQAIIARLRNRSNMSVMRGAIKKVRVAIEKNDLANVDALFREAQSIIAVTKRKGTIHANNMARNISRLCIAVKKLKGEHKPASL